MLTDLAQVMKDAFRRGFTCEDRSAPVDIRRTSQVKSLLTLTLTLTLTTTSAAETLESSNPFLPPGYGEEKPEPPKTVVVSNGPISREVEFRGVVKLNNRYQFSVFNKTEQKGYWIEENKAEGGISVRSYDAEARTLTVNMNGRSERLTLMSASDAPLPVVSSVNQATSSAKQPTLPPGIKNLNSSNNNSNSENRRRVIPRRRVILPKQ